MGSVGCATLLVVPVSNGTEDIQMEIRKMMARVVFTFEALAATKSTAKMREWLQTTPHRGTRCLIYAELLRRRHHASR